MSKKNKQSQCRNLHACHPIMQKGGVHDKTKKAKRAAAKGELRRLVDKALGGHSVQMPDQALAHAA